MAYDLYPAVDENYQFAPEVRTALSVSVELRNGVKPMTTTDRNNLPPEHLWDGRTIANTTTDKLERYDAGTLTWDPIANMSDLQSAMASAIPTGGIISFGGGAAPAGWHLCDGTVHGSAALEALLLAGGHPTPTNTPNLKDKFILGRGGALPKSGGAALVKLTGAQSGVAPHTHPASSGNNSVGHSHPVNPPLTNTNSISHTHSLSLKDGSGSGTGNFTDSNPTDDGRTFAGGTIGNNTHGHTVDIPQFNSGTNSVPHTHAITVAASAAALAAEAHENMPPYYALTYIIKL